MKCPNTECGSQVPDAFRYCPACGNDVGFPNVRLANAHAEVSALQERLEQAEASAAAGGYSDVLNSFGEALLTSKVVVARSLGIILNLIEDENRSYSTYHLELSSQTRYPKDNEFDRVRTQFESALFPNFHKQIRFGALSLDDHWLKSYGLYAMVLKEGMVAHRASVFEENPYVFASRYKILLNSPIPPGYRASWDRRDRLGKAKLYPKLGSDTDLCEFPKILLEDRAGTSESDYIEVHIFGSFNRNSIEKVIGPPPCRKEEKVLWATLKRLISDIGGTVEEIR